MLWNALCLQEFICALVVAWPYDFNMQTHPNTSATYNQSIVMGENVIIFPLSYGDA